MCCFQIWVHLIQPVHSKGHQSCVFIGRTDAKAEVPILWPPDAKSWLTAKDPDAGKYWEHREWDGWMASPTKWTWVWANSRRWWRTGNPGVLQSMRSQRVGHDNNNMWEVRWRYGVFCPGFTRQWQWASAPDIQLPVARVSSLTHWSPRHWLWCDSSESPLPALEGAAFTLYVGWLLYNMWLEGIHLVSKKLSNLYYVWHLWGSYHYIFVNPQFFTNRIHGTSFGSLVVKNLPCSAKDAGLIPGWGTEILHTLEQRRPSTAKQISNNNSTHVSRCLLN